MASADEILKDIPPSPLGPGTPHEGLRSAIAGLKLPPPAMAGLWLRCDFLHESHEVSQELHSAEGSFWHAIMHRREPDAFNSKYWWRKVGKHPVLAQLRREFPEYATPEAFVDLCERVRGSGTPEEALAVAIQQREWELLFEYSVRL
jgi:hypothetical protein